MVKLKLLLLLFATAFFNLHAMERLKNGMQKCVDTIHDAMQNCVDAMPDSAVVIVGGVVAFGVGSVCLATCKYYEVGYFNPDPWTFQSACQNPNAAVNWLQNSSPTFATTACTSALAMNGTIQDELVRQCKNIVNGSQRLADWWNSAGAMVGCNADDALKEINVARQCEVEKKFSERLTSQIEALGSAFFSQAIYDHFAKPIPLHYYRVLNAELETKLHNFIVGMKASKSLKFRIQTLKISSHDEQNQGDWGVFNLDVEREGKKHLYTVVVFKGTEKTSYKDWIADTNQIMVVDKLLGTTVPEGFHNNLNPVPFAVSKVDDDFFMNKMTLEEEILINIAQDRSQQQRNIIITGHSLGGALAKLMATRIKSKKFLDKMKGKNCENLAKAIRDARVYTFGAPQIFQKDFILNMSKDSSYTSNFIHFIGDYDPVPQLQLSRHRKVIGKYFKWFQKNERRLQELEGEQNSKTEIDFNDLGHLIILGESVNQGNDFPFLWSTDLAQETIEKIREKLTLSYYPEHYMKNYMKQLKTYINNKYD